MKMWIAGAWFAAALYGQVEDLARIREYRKAGSFSSYDRTGGNDDGFSGKDSFLRKEGDALVNSKVRPPNV